MSARLYEYGGVKGLLECGGRVKFAAEGFGLRVSLGKDVNCVLVLINAGELPEGCCSGGRDGKGRSGPPAGCPATHVGYVDIFIEVGNGGGEGCGDHWVCVWCLNRESPWQ